MSNNTTQGAKLLVKAVEATTIPKWKQHYEQGHLDGCLSFLNDAKIQDKHPLLKHIGQGASCMVFTTSGGRVLKVCRSKIRAMKYFDYQTKTMQTKINESSLSSVFAPIEILYKDQHFFIYTQPEGRVLKKRTLKRSEALGVLQVLKKMLQHNIIITDLRAANFAVVEKQGVRLIDFHDIKQPKDQASQEQGSQGGSLTRRFTWWSRVLRHLLLYSSVICYRKRFIHQFPKQKHKGWKDASQWRASGYTAMERMFPGMFVRMFRAIAHFQFHNHSSKNTAPETIRQVIASYIRQET